MKSAESQVLATVTKRIFRARRTSGENECANRVSDLAVKMEFPALEDMLFSILSNANESNQRGVFAVGREIRLGCRLS